MKTIRMISAVMFLAFIVVFSHKALACKKGSPEEHAAKQTEWMTENLNLTESQVSSVAAINLEFASAMSGIRKEYDGDREAAAGAIQSLREEKENKLRQVLTNEQFALLQEKKEERGSKRGHRCGRR